MEALPFEILSRIFTQLDIGDWIRCADVCHSWQRLVAIAVTDVFDEMYVENDGTYPSYLNSIGLFPSIRSVHLHLSNVNCLLSSLECLSKYRLSKLEISDVFLDDPNAVYAVLEQFSDSLAGLALVDMKGAYLDVTQILQACPSLHQLRYTIRFSDSTSCSSSSSVPCSKPPATASCYPLVSLQLQTESRCLFDPSVVLKNCPDLSALTIDNTLLHPVDILAWCPQLEFLHLGKKISLPGVNEGGHEYVLESKRKDAKTHPGLRYLCLPDSPVFNHGIDRILRAHSQTLQVLHLPPSSLLHNVSTDVLPNFCSLKILSTLTVQNPSGLTTVIDTCPSLEELHIMDFGSLSSSVIDTISRLRKSLIKLSFRVLFGYDGCSIAMRNSLLYMLPQLTCLTTLVFDYCSLIDGDVAISLVARISSLEDLTLGSIAPSDHMKFDALQRLPFLRRLCLRHFMFPSLLLAEQQQQQHNNNNTATWPAMERMHLLTCFVSAPEWSPNHILPKMPKLKALILSNCQGGVLHEIQDYKRWGQVELTVQ